MVDCRCGKIRKCKVCQKRYNSEWYQKNRVAQQARVKVNAARYHKESKELVRRLKSQPCADCGNSYHWFAMDFDHVHGKEMDISRAVQNGWSVKRLQAEIQKCEVVCATCHRLRTIKRVEMKVLVA